VNRLGELERAVMDALWRRGGPATVREICSDLTGRSPAYTTVMTVMDRLARKGMLTRELTGRAWRYQPARSRDEYVSALMLEALELTGDRDSALIHFAHAVSAPEAEILRRALRS
jgi:predicted transcriptional regulator